MEGTTNQISRFRRAGSYVTPEWFWMARTECRYEHKRFESTHLHARMKDAYLVTPVAYSRSGMISWPFSSTTLVISKAARIDTATIHRLFSPRNRPGHFLDRMNDLISSLSLSLRQVFEVTHRLPNPNAQSGYGSPLPFGLGRNRSG